MAKSAWVSEEAAAKDNRTITLSVETAFCDRYPPLRIGVSGTLSACANY